MLCEELLTNLLRRRVQMAKYATIYTYFLFHPELKIWKIGRSFCPMERVAALSRSFGNLILMCEVPFSLLTERDAHAFMKGYNDSFGKEWYRDCRKIRTLMRHPQKACKASLPLVKNRLSHPKTKTKTK